MSRRIRPRISDLRQEIDTLRGARDTLTKALAAETVRAEALDRLTMAQQETIESLKETIRVLKKLEDTQTTQPVTPPTSAPAPAKSQFERYEVILIRYLDRISPIKVLRKHRGLGLKEAKDLVEACGLNSGPVFQGTFEKCRTVKEDFERGGCFVVAQAMRVRPERSFEQFSRGAELQSRLRSLPSDPSLFMFSDIKEEFDLNDDELRMWIYISLG